MNNNKKVRRTSERMGGVVTRGRLVWVYTLERVYMTLRVDRILLRVAHMMEGHSGLKLE